MNRFLLIAFIVYVIHVAGSYNDLLAVEKLDNKNLVINEKLPAGFSITTLKLPEVEQFEPSGLDFDKDGTLYVSTRTAGIWKYRNETWKLYADGLYDPLGLALHKGEVYVMQKPELTRLVDEDKNGTADFYKTETYGFRFTGNYHEFAYGPVFNNNGEAFISTNLSTRGYFKFLEKDGSYMSSPLGYRGCVLKYDSKGKLSPYAYGFRSPSGIGISDKGEVFVADNQGDWVGSSYLIHVREGGFHGHPSSIWDSPKLGGGEKINYKNINRVPAKVPEITKEEIVKQRLLPTVWFPHKEFANSPGSPEFNYTEKFGPFKGQMFVPDYSLKNVLRVDLEKVGGEYQGAVFHFARNLPCGGLRLKFNDDGHLYIGELSRGWGRGKPGIQVIRWDGETTPFEMQSVKLNPDGFDITMTKPVGGIAPSAENFEIKSYTYNYWSTYGSPKVDEKSIAVESVNVSDDGTKISIKLPLEEKRIFEIKLKNISSAGGDSLINEVACYTLNKLKETSEKPRVSRVFLENTPIRSVAIGYPNKFNTAIDSVTMTPAYIWYGDYIDFHREKHGRGGHACKIKGQRINLDLPKAPLRIDDYKKMPDKILFKGYRRPSADAPTLYGSIDDCNISLQVTESEPYKVSLKYKFLSNRNRDAYFLTGKLLKSNIAFDKGVAWHSEGVLKIPEGINTFEVIINTINNDISISEDEVLSGEQIFMRNCSACHTLNGAGQIGPSLKGIMGRKTTVVSDGKEREVKADSAYIKQSILSPQSDIVKQFLHVPMPSFKDVLNKEEIEKLIDFLKDQN